MVGGRFAYPVIVNFGGEDGLSMTFYDMPSVKVIADTFRNTRRGANEALYSYLLETVNSGKKLPQPTDESQIKCDEELEEVMIISILVPYVLFKKSPEYI